MLNAIYQALSELSVHTLTDIFTDKLAKGELGFLEQIAGYLARNGEITNYRAQLLTNKSSASAKKYLGRFVQLGLLEAVGENKGRKYIVANTLEH